jgi:hypothetical protein
VQDIEPPAHQPGTDGQALAGADLRTGSNPPRLRTWLAYCCSLVAYSMPTAYTGPAMHRQTCGRHNSSAVCRTLSRHQPGTDGQTLAGADLRTGSNPPRLWSLLAYCCSLVAYSMPTAYTRPAMHRQTRGRRNSSAVTHQPTCMRGCLTAACQKSSDEVVVQHARACLCVE